MRVHTGDTGVHVSDTGVHATDMGGSPGLPSVADMLRQTIITGVRHLVHLVHVSSQLRTLLDDRCTRLAVRWAPPRSIFGGAINPSVVADLLPTDPRIELELGAAGGGSGLGRWRFPHDHWATHISVGAPQRSVLAAMLAANPGRTPHVVVTDDGLRSYAKPDPSPSRRLVPRDRWALFQREETGWQVNEQVAREFRRRVGPLTVDPERAVILTQPRVITGLLDVDTHLDQVHQIAAMLRAEGKHPVVRHHPAEDPQLYDGLEVVGGNGPAELDPSVLTAAEVIGEPSATLLNLAAIHGRRARMVPSLADIGLTTHQRELLATYVEPAWVTEPGSCGHSLVAQP